MEFFSQDVAQDFKGFQMEEFSRYQADMVEVREGRQLFRLRYHAQPVSVDSTHRFQLRAGFYSERSQPRRVRQGGLER